MSLPLPSPDRLHPLDGPVVRWGILGTGWAADRFLGSVLSHTNHQVAAIGSRDLARSTELAERHGGRPCGSYEELVAQDDVDVVYVATRHPHHVDHALLAIEAGRHVLVEMPMAVDAAGARQIAAAARARGVFCAEAMWSMFLPKFTVLRTVLDEGLLGDIHLLSADLGEYFDDDHRINDPAAAGGAMMDLGTYLVAFATWALGRPTEIHAQGVRGPSGVMAQTVMELRHGDTTQSALEATSLVRTPTSASISGSKGFATLEGPFYKPGPLTVRTRDGQVLRHEETPIAHAALFYEALEVARCLDAGLLETPIRPLDATILTLEVMDEVRALTGDALVGAR
ncbi:Gfo/Idh/MocA family protein [Arsenicicoccus dermatophilus]|uniref:Gfo/Idh/MocA family protein n=1 Tax=Arsenicicoccus dermatophilus TaxID=1076331 RepID=UPI001F4C56CD|nr:Gfo/Idh/MocA family oxidoreductase [Arsenicicoccus dermatophilus]MCH8614126.1 Gfo/Idh/MocA family oxidoreductase [Arsenicicoccus dermatophilus]